MKKLILSISTAIFEFGPENVDAETLVKVWPVHPGLYEVSVNNLPPTSASRNIEAELLLTQTKKGLQFDEATAREWVESLGIIFPIEELPPQFDEHVEDLKAVGLPVATSSAEFENLVSPIGSSLEKIEPLKELNATEIKTAVNNFRSKVSSAVSADEYKELTKVRDIINSVKRGPGIRDRRIASLEAAGYKVIPQGIIKNFGRSGSCEMGEGHILAQLEANVNYTDCYVYEISK